MGQERPENPRLRPLEAIPIEQDGQTRIYLRDPSGESEELLLVSESALEILRRLDGSRGIDEIQVELCRVTGEIVPRTVLEEFVARLEAASFLDSAAFRDRQEAERAAFLASAIRPASFAGKSYEDDPERLSQQIDLLLGAASDPATDDVRQLIAPHIDPVRGGKVYGSAFRALRGNDSRRIVILGISHAGGPVPYATLDKDFDTPLGRCKVDRAFLERLHAGLPFDPAVGAGLHRREHSIEFQTIFLRHTLPSWDERRIVPILCCTPWLPPELREQLPYPDSWRAAFSERLAEIIDSDTLVIAGVDFAHVGRRFGDPEPRLDQLAPAIEQADRAMMETIAGRDLAAFRQSIEQSNDARRVCGVPALVTLLEMPIGSRGEILDYDQSIDETTDSLVSFGAIAFGR